MTIDAVNGDATRRAARLARRQRYEWRYLYRGQVVHALVSSTDTVALCGVTKIEAVIKAAQLELERRETDLLTELATSVLGSKEAREFLARIPTVSALVPASRLAELEASLWPDGDPA